MKKIIISMLTFLLVITGICLINVDASTVLAEENNTKFVAELLNPEKGQIPTHENYIFAGWYKDETCTEPYYATPSEDAWAKFVPEKVLSVKLQLTKDTHERSSTTNMRLVTSVDSLDYRKVGFKVYFNGAANAVDTGSTKVFERIVASAESGVDYKYSPKVVDVESEYFVTATLINIANKNFDKNFFIKPYWITLDGTEVYGVNRYVNVNNGISTANINIPVKVGAKLTSPTVMVAGVTYEANAVYYDGTYAHLNINVPNRDSVLKSVSQVSVSEGPIVGDAIYRNLHTTHASGDFENPTVDTTWYEAYKDEPAYVIATSADLYGFAHIVNGTATDSSGATMQSNFMGKTVYIVADIELNKGYANKGTLKWMSTLASDGKTAITDGTSYKWTDIGNTTSATRFNGTFDGQMHTISGVYFVRSSANFHGFFGGSGSDAVIKRFKLLNSYFAFGAGTNNGSIVGRAYGTEIDTVYSDAVIQTNHTNVGGIVGNANTGGVTMNNCWFNGVVKSTCNRNASGYVPNAGGLIGNMSQNSMLTNCLNTGQITASADSVSTSPGVGGLVGNVASGKTLTLENCLNSGSITTNDVATAGYGAIIGNAKDAEGDYGTATITNTYATTDHCAVAVNATTDDNVEMLAVADISGTNALSENTKNLFTYITDTAIEGYWAVVAGGTPVLADFAEVAGIENYIAIDTNWYNTEDSVFVLKDAADFYGFTMLSRVEAVNGFENKTVKLAKDITLNTGDANTWSATVAPDYQWLCIGPNGTPFMGSFDGEGHKISGVYLKADAQIQGLFGYTQTTGFIKNFSLINSYLYSPSDKLGGIVGTGYGNFDSIYCDAKVELKKTSAGYYLGGFIGLIDGSTTNTFTMDNCWFAGEVVASGTTTRLGGLVGGTRHVTVTIDNSLNSGTISSEANGTLYQGGLVGFRNSGSVTLTNCLNTGELLFSEGDGTTTPTTYGLVIGENDCTTTNTYTINQEGVDYKYGSANADYTLEATTLYGTAAMEQMPTFYDLVTVDNKQKVYWAVTETTPILGDFIEFADEEVVAVAFDTSWYDGSKNYTLYDESDLYGFAKLSEVEDFAGETVKLGADITIPNDGMAEEWYNSVVDTSVTDIVPSFNWYSIGTSSNAFNGTFFGQGHKISGIYQNTTQDINGLFGYTGASVAIRELRVGNSYFNTTKNTLGSIVGYAIGGTLDAIYSDAFVRAGTSNLGGLVGKMEGNATFTMNNCWFNGKVRNFNGGKYIGGLIGDLINAGEGYPRIITNCLNTGEVIAQASASTYAGGLIGRSSNGKGLTVSNCLNATELTYNTSKITTADAVKGKYYGLIAGQLQTNTTINGVYTIAQENVPSVANGKIPDSSAVRDVSTICYIDAINDIPTLFAYKDSTGAYKNYWALTEGTPILSIFAEYADGDVIELDTSWYNGTDNTFTLNDIADLYGFALLSRVKDINGFVDKTINLEKNITIYSTGAEGWADGTEAPFYQWPGIGTSTYPFNGTFNGNKNTIKGIYMNSDTAYSALFNYTGLNAVIQDFSLTNSYFASSANYLGSIAGLGRGTYNKIYSDAIVVGSKQAIGGLIGQAYDKTNDGDVVTMSNCWFAGSVTNNGNSTSDRYTGGLIGLIQCNTVISNSLNTGTVSAPKYTAQENPDADTPDTSVRPYTGGLAGFLGSSSTLTLSYCLNTGKVTYKEAATTGYGAILGRANTGTTVSVPNEVYATTASCAAVASIHSGATSELNALNVHVVDNTIKGEAATATALFEEANAGVWMTVENETPILSYFEAWKGDSTSPEVTENSLTTAINDAQKKSSYLIATMSSPIILSDDVTKDAITRRQGGCYVEKEDGTYYYQAFLQEYFSDEEKNNAVVIVKYDLSTNKEVMRSQTFAGDGYRMFHANDLTYNSKLDLLVVACGDGNSSKVVFINPDDLTWVGHKVLDCGIFALDYNATYDCYIVQTGTNDVGEGHYSYVLNGDMEIIAKYEDTIEVTKGEKTLKVHCDPRQTTGAGQGAACDDNYMYYLFSGDGIHSITVFDWTGNYVTEIQFTSSHEPESITVVDGTIYFNVLNSSEVYTLGSFSVK